MSEPLTDQAAVILLERLAVPLANRAGSGLWSWLTANIFRRPRAAMEEVSTDFISDVALRLRDQDPHRARRYEPGAKRLDLV